MINNLPYINILAEEIFNLQQFLIFYLLIASMRALDRKYYFLKRIEIKKGPEKISQGLFLISTFILLLSK